MWLVVFLLTKYASLASLAAAVALPIAAFAFGASWPIVGFSTAAAVAVAILHRHNVGRLLAGNEPRFTRVPKPATGRPVP